MSFSWSQNQPIADWVFEKFPLLGSIDTAKQVHERWGVHLSPGAIRGYVCHRRKGVLELTAPTASPSEPWADRRPNLTQEDARELFHWATEEVERKEAASTAQTTLTC